jgi:CRP-like cAMP-binding protein
MKSLRELELFADCTREELRRVASAVTEVRVEPGQVLLREGGFGDQFLVVSSGQLRVRRADVGTVAVLGAGGFSGEMALLNGTRRSATVTALTPAVVYASTPNEFKALKEIPSVAAKVRAAADQRARINQLAA